MSRIRGWLYGLRAVVRRSRVDDELDEELQDHARREIERQTAAGLAADDARRQARMRLGNVDAAKDAVRDERGGRIINDAIDDARIGLRGLRKNPGFGLAVVLSLALGVGGTTAIFSVVHAVVLRALPYPDAPQLHILRIWWNDFSSTLSPADVIALDETARAVGSTASFFYPDAGFTMLSPSGPEVVDGVFVTDHLPDVLGIRPEVGGGFTASKNGDEALISHALWIRRFGGGQDVLGRAITLDDHSYTIVGVMPSGFDVPRFKRTSDVWVRGRLEEPKRRGPFFIQQVVRLDAVREPSLAAQRLTELATPILRDRYGVKPDWRYGLRPVQDSVVGDTTQTLWLAFGGVCLVLLIAVLNVSNLLLARGTARARELAVRASLGAGRARLARQLLVESALLGLAGGLLGLAFAVIGLRLARDAALEIVPRMDEVQLSVPVILFALAVGVGAGLLAGLVPVLRLPWDKLSDRLREGTRAVGDGRQGLARGVLVAAEIAVALTVLVGAALLAKSFSRLEQTNPGIDPRGVLTFRLSLPYSSYDAQRAEAFMRSLDLRLREIAPVTTVAYASGLPPDRSELQNNITLEGDAPDGQGASLIAEQLEVSPGYFTALSIPLTRGRAFAATDREGAPLVAIVNESFARHQYPGQDPIGRRYKGGNWSPTAPWITIVGVVGDVPYGPRGVWGGSDQTVYTAYAQNLWALSPYVVVKAEGDPAAIVASARAAVLAVDPKLPLRDVATMPERLRASMLVARFRTFVSLTLAAIALALAITGVYGVMSYHVSQRRRETAIRRALGARRAQVIGSVVGAGMRLAAIGVMLGSFGAIAAMGTLRTVLYRVPERDPAMLTLAVLVLMAAAALACGIPAARAARVDPMTILRDE